MAARGPLESLAEQKGLAKYHIDVGMPRTNSPAPKFKWGPTHPQTLQPRISKLKNRSFAAEHVHGILLGSTSKHFGIHHCRKHSHEKPTKPSSYFKKSYTSRKPQAQASFLCLRRITGCTPQICLAQRWLLKIEFSGEGELPV